MSRITDTERGARMALELADGMLAAASARADLFPLRLTPRQRQIWKGIREAAMDELAEQAACRAALSEVCA